MTSPAPAGARERVRLRHVVLLAVSVRVLHLYFVAQTPVFSYHRTFAESDMYMFDSWAHKILDGDVLGRERNHPLNQWQLRAAPLEKWTAWYGRDPVFYKAPFYPYLIALLYRLCGDAMAPLAVLQILASAAAIVLLFRITDRLFGPTAGIFATLILALYAPAVHFDAIMLRGPWIVLTALLTTWRLLELRRTPRLRNAVVLGATVGAAVLVNEGFTAALALAAVLFVAWFRDPRRIATLLGGLALGLALSLAPVVARNVIVGSPPFKLAVTGSTVYAVFNAAGSSPYFFETRPAVFMPMIEAGGGDLFGTVLACFRSFATPADVLAFYFRKSLGLLILWENTDNVSIYYVALRTPVLGLLPGYAILLPLAAVGLALAARQWRALAGIVPAAVTLVLSILLALPLSRYRATLAVFLMPFAGLALHRILAWAKERRFVGLGLATTAVVLSLIIATTVQARVVFGGRPAGSYLYRSSEFLLGADFYERQGRLAEASREALDLARLNPDRRVAAMALVLLGRIEAERGNESAAREALAGASRLGGDDPSLLMAVGDLVSSRLKDPAAAIAIYRQAARIPGNEPLRQALEDRLRRLEVAESAR